MSLQNNNWQVTDEEEIVPVRKAKKTQTVSRSPAAIAGILIVVALGTVFFHDMRQITGQVTQDDDTIRITESGFDPIVITTTPGGTITWKNEQEIPHYLLSDSLCNTQNECMTTSTMFSGDETTYSVPVSVQPGAYTYFSPTDPNLIGTISIGGDPVTPTPNPTPTPTPSPNPTPTADPLCYSPSDCTAPEHCSSLDDGIIPGTCVTGAVLQNQTPETVETAQTTEIPEESNPLLDSIKRQLALDGQNGGGSPSTSGGSPSQSAIPGIPQNPYTVDSTNANPPPVQEVESPITANVQKPFRQPNTGPGTWLAGVLSLLALWFVTRNVFTAYTK